MKNLLLVLTLVFLVAPALHSCRETKEKTVVIEKETKEEKGVLEKAGEKVDKEVNDEIDKTIDEIGDDN